MNTKISKLLSALSEVELNLLLTKFKDASLTREYLKLLIKSKKENLSTRKIVESLYPNFNPNEFPKYENRFYKLRKKIFDELKNFSTNKSAVASSFSKEEKLKEDCKELISSGKFNEAELQLSQLKKTCFDYNIFELLPEILDMLIQTKHALNKFKETDTLYAEFKESIVLFTHIYEAKILVKKIYEFNLREGITATNDFFKELSRLSRLHANKPRFKLIYNFVAGYYKAGAGGSDKLIKSNVINRHIQVAKKMMQDHPKIPVVNYSLNYEFTQNYRLAELEAMIDFRSFRFKIAAEKIYELLKKVLDSNDFLKRMLSEILISNAIHMQIAAMNEEKALECVQIYLKFIRDNKYHERLIRVYCELANVVTTMGVKESFISNQKLMTYINEYERSLQTSEKTDSIESTLFLKLKMHWLMKEYEPALFIIQQSEIKNYFATNEIRILIIELLEAYGISLLTIQSIKEFKSRWIKLKYNSKKSEDALLFNWIETVIEDLSKLYK